MTDASADRLKVVFIGGCSRSGSTLLGRLLDQLPGWQHVGELHQLWKRSVHRNSACECGKPFRDCGLWQQVMHEAFGGIEAVDVQAMRDLRRRAHRAALAGRDNAPAVSEYAAILARILRRVAACTPARTIVDSSKSAAHGAVLLAAGGLDVRVVHLLRDPRGVANSLGRQRTMSGQAIPMERLGAIGAARHWRRENRRTASLAPAAIRLQYETLAADPGGTLRWLLEQLDSPPQTLGFIDGSTAKLAGGHSLCGNPMRHRSGPMEICNDDAWREQMPLWRQRLVRWLTRGPARSYGYQ